MYLVYMPGTHAPRYLCDTGDFTTVRSLAKQFTADDAIAKQNELVKAGHTGAHIERAAHCLADQLTPHKRDSLAWLVGADPNSERFKHFLAVAKPVDEFALRAAAYSYLEAMKRFLDGTAPEART